jgi:drug/metabolite transporter (DMT)-like permease
MSSYHMKKAHIAGLLFSTIFGFTFMFSKIALDYISPLGLIAYRFMIAFASFELLRLFKIIKIRFQKHHMLPVFLVALFQPILYFLFETFGVALTQSGEAGMMIALIPIVVSILSTVILKERPKLSQLFFILLSVSGIVFIQVMKMDQGLEGSILGFALLFGAVLAAAMFNIASRKASQSWKPYELTYFMMMSGAVVFNLIYFVELANKGELSSYLPSLLGKEVIFPILYLGVIASIGGFFFVNYALSKLPAHVSSIYTNLSTIVAILAGSLILREVLYYYHYIGGIMIIIGVYGTVWMNQKNRRIIHPKIDQSPNVQT